MTEELFLGQYELLHQIGKGAFAHVFEGEEYAARDVKTGKAVAVKVGTPRARSSMKHEARLLQKFSHRNIPKLLHLSKQGKRTIEVMQLLGSSLYQLVKEGRVQPDPSTLYRIYDQALRVLKYVHSKGYVHGDIKPDNFVLGGSCHPDLLFLVDFCESKCYAECQESKAFAGSPYFASTRVLQGKQYSPRDDLESLCYVFAYLSTKTLPWLRAFDMDPSECVKQVLATRGRVDLHSEWTAAPPFVLELVDYVRSLQPSDFPDYDHLIKRVAELAQEREVLLDAKTPLWEQRRRASLRGSNTMTVKMQLGSNLHFESGLLASIRFSRCSTLSPDTAEIATIVSLQLPTLPAALRTPAH